MKSFLREPLRSLRFCFLCSFSGWRFSMHNWGTTISFSQNSLVTIKKDTYLSIHFKNREFAYFEDHILCQN